MRIILLLTVFVCLSALSFGAEVDAVYNTYSDNMQHQVRHTTVSEAPSYPTYTVPETSFNTSTDLEGYAEIDYSQSNNSSSYQQPLHSQSIHTEGASFARPMSNYNPGSYDYQNLDQNVDQIQNTDYHQDNSIASSQGQNYISVNQIRENLSDYTIDQKNLGKGLDKGIYVDDYKAVEQAYSQPDLPVAQFATENVVIQPGQNPDYVLPVQNPSYDIPVQNPAYDMVAPDGGNINFNSIVENLSDYSSQKILQPGAYGNEPEPQSDFSAPVVRNEIIEPVRNNFSNPMDVFNEEVRENSFQDYETSPEQDFSQDTVSDPQQADKPKEQEAVSFDKIIKNLSDYSNQKILQPGAYGNEPEPEKDFSAPVVRNEIVEPVRNNIKNITDDYIYQQNTNDSYTPKDSKKYDAVEFDKIVENLSDYSNQNILQPGAYGNEPEPQKDFNKGPKPTGIIEPLRNNVGKNK